VSDPARGHGLNLGFAEVSGAFLGDVTVVIQDRSGTELVNTVVDGPWFFVPLPAGSYNVKAVFDEQVKQIKDVRLSEKHVTMMVVYWDLNVPATQMMATAQDAFSS
jgi:nitrogenase molybdenum-iron protein alpha/beta subunit